MPGAPSAARARGAALPAGLLLGAFLAGQLLGQLKDGATIPLAVIVGQGVLFGSLNALVAIGLVLIYRSSRIINFSQAGFGSAAAGLFLLLVSAWKWNMAVALLVSVLAAGAAGLVVEALIVRRFTRAPRLVLTVVTIVIGQLLLAVTTLLPRMFGYGPDAQGHVVGIPSRPPVSPLRRFRFDWNPVVFTGDHAAVIGFTVAALAGLALFLRFSRVGIAVRGASENAGRAEQLGVNTGVLSSVVWVMVAVIAGVGGILSVLASQQSVNSALAATGMLAGASGLRTLVRALAAAIAGRMENLPVTVAAAVALSIVEQSILWTIRDTSVVDLLLFAVILGVLLLQRSVLARSDQGANTSWQASEEIRAIPSELAGLDAVKEGVRRFRWVGALAILAYPFVMSPSQTSMGATYAIYGMIGISLVVLTGWGGQISLGQFAFVAVGALVGGAATAKLGLPFPLAVLAGALAGAGAAVVAGLPALRIQGLFLAVTTLALAVMTSTVLLNPKYVDWLLPDHLSRPKLLFVDMNADDRSYYFLCLAALVATIYAVTRLRVSRTGRVLIAMRDNERAAQAFGISLVKARLSAFAVSGFIAGAAGVLYAHQQRSVSPAAYGPELSLQIFLMAVLGGLGSVYAVLVGALYLGTVTVIIPDLGGQLLASGIGVLAILLLFPAGLGALAYRGRDAWLRRLAQRFQVFVPSLAEGRIKRGEEALVALAPRVIDGEVEPVYRIESRIGETGASQRQKVWRY